MNVSLLKMTMPIHRYELHSIARQHSLSTDILSTIFRRQTFRRQRDCRQLFVDSYFVDNQFFIVLFELIKKKQIDLIGYIQGFSLLIAKKSKPDRKHLLNSTKNYLLFDTSHCIFCWPICYFCFVFMNEILAIYSSICLAK